MAFSVLFAINGLLEERGEPEISLDDSGWMEE